MRYLSHFDIHALFKFYRIHEQHMLRKKLIVKSSKNCQRRMQNLLKFRHFNKS